ncbi:SMAD/FHA domain-containing protein [Kockovaella imperatae]|uniref:SMAD/FHA domain-containing protein n=1 Tax=Kockovaella imperatae TaxID=4999 RepID=A0A1Y1URC9_9TREE|nr:SMAD/FHA domain-containing protein [Kockovaella imperatae]ORX40621.1 SMAD/FHA domain-containing protein [Kockovaella imperatae]
MDRDASPPRRRARRSASPPQRNFEHQGGGRSSSRNRSPGHYVKDSRDREPRRSGGGSGEFRDAGYGNHSRGSYEDSRSGRDPGHRHGRSRDDGYGDRSRPRDNGYGDRNGGSRRRDGDYTAQDRERERASDRSKYELEATGEDKEKALIEASKPNFSNSGLLAKETNTVKGVELKYNEPPEARKPLKNWRLYVFKGKEQLDLIHIYRQSAYLVGRDQVVTDIPISHPSCSKQHAAIQFRQITEKNEYGDVTSSVKPFIIDLDSTNGTHVNDQEIPKSRYYELRNSDVIKFGTSSREYVLLHEDASS